MNGLDFLSNEPVEGELLADRLARGGLPPEEALRLAIEIGSALAKAHARGAVHGGLSPFTIAITSAGARLLQPPRDPDERITPYRAPEQALGEPPDSRSDIFAYGAVLYEMAGERRAFPGEGWDRDKGNTETLPPTQVAKSPIHAAMEGVIAVCLEKDPARRRQRVQNAVAELKLAGRASTRLAEFRSRQAQRALAPAVPAPKVPGPRPRLGIILLAVFTVAVAVLAAVLYLRATPAQVFSFPVPPPEHTSYPSMPSVSPDGRYLTLSAVGPEGKRMLWLRPLDAEHPVVIPETEGGYAPFWSPDSDFIAFFANRALKKVHIKGGVETICPVETDAESRGGGGTWNRDGVILFSPNPSDGLYRVPAAGGQPRPVLTLSEPGYERSHRWPQFLPDGRHFVFYVLTDLFETSGVYAGALDSPEYHLLFRSDTNAVYSPLAGQARSGRGYLLYMRDHNLVGQPFNAARLQMEGDPVTLREKVGAVRSLALAPVSVSNNATLVYQSVGEPTRQLAWMDRTGKLLSTAGSPGEWGPPRISRDGARAAAAKLGPDGTNADLWILNADGSAVQFTSTPGHEGSPVWSPDGSRIAFFGNLEGDHDIYAKLASGAGKTDLLFKSPSRKRPTDWSRDGRFIFFDVLAGEGTKSDVWAYCTANRHAGPILETIYNEGFAALSPDGKWLAYQSDEARASMLDIHVQSFEGLSVGTKRQWQVSSGGGGEPRWRADGGELYYMTSSGRMMAVTVHPRNGGFEFDPPHTLFQTRPIPRTWNLYDVSPDGQRFLMNLPLEWSGASPVNVVTNWTEKLKGD